ncbi:DUF2637 domain-containing protein [Cellulomonas sp. JH27-2]|uniref:DUF2637 domain-containing protein n=1 Tax=Cellulomonas sp. JH27-2 TaxID=2774139 RepID=UPI001783859A|nr:DUF2637 domain-containing protein [Cellulomonas sp. JH27-2]MBD8059048.1 DUF2637 domain-containing protein [Cellulomonas sp. JH27-2]
MSTKPKTAARPTVHRARIPADAMTVLVVQVLALLGVWVCAIAVSFSGLVAAANWANIHGSQRYAVPLFIDGILVGASLAYLVARERKDKASAVIAVLAMAAFCGLSILGNATHALGSAAAGSERLTGVALAVAAPIAILLTTELLARTVIASPEEHVPAPSRSARRAARVVAQQPAQSATPVAAAAPTQPTTDAEPVRARRTATGAGSAGRTEREALKAEVLRLAAEGLSHRAITAQLEGAVPATTVGRWIRDAAEQNDGEPILVAV